MAGKKFYGVKVGRNPGVYESWEACKAQVDGYKGAIYKGFATKKEAEIFVGIGSKQLSFFDAETECYTKEWAQAYVDGSFDSASGKFAAGGVILYQDAMHEFSFCCDDEELASMHNVAGEIKGAEYAMAYCIENGIGKLAIFHDYEGIAAWCTGKWQANKKGTQEYRAYYQQAKEYLEIDFIKVKGHSGVKYNELADKLAKKALNKE